VKVLPAQVIQLLPTPGDPGQPLAKITLPAQDRKEHRAARLFEALLVLLTLNLGQNIGATVGAAVVGLLVGRDVGTQLGRAEVGLGVNEGLGVGIGVGLPGLKVGVKVGTPEAPKITNWPPHGDVFPEQP